MSGSTLSQGALRLLRAWVCSLNTAVLWVLLPRDEADVMSAHTAVLRVLLLRYGADVMSGGGGAPTAAASIPIIICKNSPCRLMGSEGGRELTVPHNGLGFREGGGSAPKP